MCRRAAPVRKPLFTDRRNPARSRVSSSGVVLAAKAVSLGFPSNSRKTHSHARPPTDNDTHVTNIRKSVGMLPAAKPRSRGMKQATGADLAWAVTHTALDVVPGDGRRPLSKALVAFLAGVAVAAVALGAFMLGRRELERVNKPSAQPTSTAVLPMPADTLPRHEVLTPVITPVAKPAPPALVTAPESPPTATVDVSPPEAAGIPSPALSPQSDRARDQWLLDNLRSLGYVIINPPVVIHKAHEACRLFQQDESPEQVNRQMSAITGMNLDDTVQLTSSAMLAYYPNCA